MTVPGEPLVMDRWLSMVLTRVMACACDELAKTPGGPVARSGLVWSDAPVVDGCSCPCDPSGACACDGSASGRFSVRVSNAIRYVGDPIVAGLGMRCAPGQWIDDVRLGIFRCAVGERPGLRSDVEEQRMFVIAQADRVALRRAVVCCRESLPTNLRVEPYTWTTIGPQGGCYGGELALRIVTP